MLQFKTRDETSPNGKAWVFLCALPEEAQARLAAVCADIFRFCNCAVWYDDGVDTTEDELESAIAQSAMAVMPVTVSLLDPDSPVQRYVRLLQKHQVSQLPVLEDPHLLAAFNERFRNIQVLDKYSTDKTAIPYEEKLKRFLDTMLLRDELAVRVRQAFRSQLFLSYRKKDRALALDLMKRIHKEPPCRSIRLWYDEFLTPGEDFDENIEQAIRESDLFLLALTQNMVGEDNYVIQEEYPCARGAEKEILPVKLEPVDCQRVRECFSDIPPLLDSAEAPRYLAQQMENAPEATPEQDYLLGLAFIRGFSVERQVKLGLEQLEHSARRGFAPAALQLADMQILEETAEEQKERKFRWLKEYAALAAGEYKKRPDSKTAQQYADALDRLAAAEFERHPGVAFILYEQAIQILESYGCLAESAQICSNYGMKLTEDGKNQDGLQMLMKALQQYSDQYKADPEWGKSHTAQFSYCYYNIGNVAAQTGDLRRAQVAYNAAIQNFAVLAKSQPEEYTLILAQAHGNLANVYRRQWVGSGEEEHCAKAEAYHIRAIEILHRVIEWNPKVYEPAYAQELAALAAVYLQKPEHDKAELVLSDAIEILRVYEGRYPGQYADVLASALGNRAVLYLSQDKIESAREDYRAAIGIFRKFPVRRMELAKALWNLAITYSMKDDFEPARRYFEEAIAIYEDGTVQNSERNQDFAQCCYNYANTLCGSGAYAEAVQWANRTMEVYRSLQDGSGGGYTSRIEDMQRLINWVRKQP